MSGLFGSIYELFQSLYGFDLGQHLEGWNGEDFVGNNLYVSTGWIVLIITVLSVVTFYYFINSPRFARWYHWILVLIINSIILFGISYTFVRTDLINGSISPDLEPLIQNSHIVFWGISNAILSGSLFVIFSFLLRWWSTNCSTTPIPQ